MTLRKGIYLFGSIYGLIISLFTAIAIGIPSGFVPDSIRHLIMQIVSTKDAGNIAYTLAFMGGILYGIPTVVQNFTDHSLHEHVDRYRAVWGRVRVMDLSDFNFFPFNIVDLLMNGERSGRGLEDDDDEDEYEEYKEDEDE